MAGEIRTTPEFETWYSELSENQRDGVYAAIEILEEGGPTLGRPFVDRIKSSRYHNMKELRPLGAAKHCRILFIFDPRRDVILLTGGDKTGDWEGWYKKAIPHAEELFAAYLAEADQTE